MKAKIEFNESCTYHKAKLTWNTTAVGFKARRDSSGISDNKYNDVHKCVCVAYIENTSNLLTHNVYIHDGNRFYSMC